MKVLQISIIRAIFAMVVGVLLIKYREETMWWMTITVGVLFFLSGIISCIIYYFEKNKFEKAASQIDDSENASPVKRPTLPIVGIGSAILGIILAMMPGDFIKWVVYILAAILILGAINQFMNLAYAKRYAHVPVLFWFFPIITLGIGILIISKPIEAATLPLKIIGWCLIFYGVVEMLNAIKIFQMKRAFDKNEQSKIVTGTRLQEVNDIEDAVIVEDENKEGK
ncbi:DUF308 domain-containing protein [Prevotella corporis]|uniref:DUF308 domain-containing protein n=1 Tax=Prevotella corporis TaxID=28128 RepID=UPI0023EF6A93|nr:DUF308 domain-containing protein [Prevotella corporis]